MRRQPTADLVSWDGEFAQALIRSGDVGGLIRWSRTQQHRWSQTRLGELAGYSAATVSRAERSASAADLGMVKALAAALGMPSRVLAAVLRISDEPEAADPRVGSDLKLLPEDDSMLRRTLLAAGLTIPASLLVGVDDALAVIPESTGESAHTDVRTHLTAARRNFDRGAYAAVLEDLPTLLAAAHAPVSGGAASGLDFAVLAGCYDLATDTMSKIGAYDTGRITADRSTVYANLSGSPLAAASSARMLSIVLRHRGEAERATRVSLEAADKVQATGLKTAQQTAMYAQILASCSYTAAGNGDRASALELVAESEKAAARLPGALPINGTLIGPNQVALYKIGTLWALGDGGAAIDAGRHLTPAMFATAERRARLHTDRGRAWWLQGKPEQTAEALTHAFLESPEEVRDRPSIRAIVDELGHRHLGTVGVRDLVEAVTGAATKTAETA